MDEMEFVMSSISNSGAVRMLPAAWGGPTAVIINLLAIIVAGVGVGVGVGAAGRGRALMMAH